LIVSNDIFFLSLLLRHLIVIILIVSTRWPEITWTEMEITL